MKWTNEQNAFLKESIKAKADHGEVSLKLKRTPGAVYVHAYEMGLDPKSIGWSANMPPSKEILKSLKEELGKVGTRKKHAVIRKHVFSIRKMDRKQLEQMSKILSISNGKQFENEFFRMFPKATTQIMYNVYSHRKKNLKTVQNRLKELDAADAADKKKVISAAQAASRATGVPMQVFTRTPKGSIEVTRTKSTPDLETLMVELVNQSKLQSQYLAEIASKLPKAS